jgi:predicted RNA-binding Zn-ribbon protein involved in translation (DUF1610 family)
VPECPICSSPVRSHKEGSDWSVFDCPRCGRWQIDRDSSGITLLLARKIGREWDAQAVHRRTRLSHILRRQQPADQFERAIMPSGNLESWHLDEPLPTPTEQLDNLILWLGKHQPSIAESATISVPEISAWIGVSITRSSPDAGLGWLLDEETAKALLEDRGEQSGKKLLRLKMAGWNRYELLKRGQVESRRVLMAMKFNTPELNDPQLDELVNIFRPAVKRSGFELYTLVDGPAGLIDDQLRVALRTSRFIIADLTHASRGAYWESGFAEGLGRPVIYTCRRKEWDEEKTHFDTNHLRTIVWDPAKWDKAAAQLTAMIRVSLPEEATMAD